VCGVQRPVGLAQHFPRQQHQVCLPGADDVVCLFRLGDESDGACRNPGLFPDALREGNLKSGRHRNLCVGHQSAGRAIDEIDAFGLQDLRERDGLIGVPATFGPISR